jgi:hypothetical protein
VVHAKQTVAGVIGRIGLWITVLTVVLSVLSVQQSWAAIVCHCESHDELLASFNNTGRESEHSEDARHSACHHAACEPATATADEDADESVETSQAESSASESHAVPGNTPDSAVRSVMPSVSCCCLRQATPSEVSAASFAVREPVSPGNPTDVVVPDVSMPSVSIRIHGPPDFTNTRPLYIVQSSLLI